MQAATLQNINFSQNIVSFQHPKTESSMNFEQMVFEVKKQLDERKSDVQETMPHKIDERQNVERPKNTRVEDEKNVEKRKEEFDEKYEPAEKNKNLHEKKDLKKIDERFDLKKTNRKSENHQNDEKSVKNRDEKRLEKNQKGEKSIQLKNQPKKNSSKDEKIFENKEDKKSLDEDLSNLLENSKKIELKNEELSRNVMNFIQNAPENVDFSMQNVSQDFLLENDFSEIQEVGFEAKNPKKFVLDKEGKFTVTDYRTYDDSKNSEKIGETGEKNALKVSDVKFDGKNSAEITLDLNNIREINQNVYSENAQTASAQGSNFQEMLTNQIRENASEFVKTANFILRDNDAGQIKLVLNPQELGNVKIDLRIDDKNISGKIIVSSEQAFNSFKDGSDSLKQAFINSGFESAGLDIAFSNQGKNSQQQMEQNRQNQAMLGVNRTYGEGYGVFADGDEEKIPISAKNLINLVA